MLLTWHEIDTTEPELVDIFAESLKLFPYVDDNLTDDINSAKRLIYINGFIRGLEYIPKSIIIKTNFKNNGIL